MSFLLVKSIRLGPSTVQAWRNAGGVFASRGLSTLALIEMGREHDFILNLGSTGRRLVDNSDNPVFVLNKGDDVKPLLTPGSTREFLPDEWLPPRPTTFPAWVWIKKPGRAGRGGTRLVAHYPLVLPAEWDWQSEVEGQEYRFITVGRRIVQCFERHGDNSRREYHWVRMNTVQDNLKAMVRTAAARMSGYNVVAWDTIVTQYGYPYIFEGNSCPGMSLRTADRIVREVLRLKEEVQREY